VKVNYGVIARLSSIIINVLPSNARIKHGSSGDSQSLGDEDGDFDPYTGYLSRHCKSLTSFYHTKNAHFDPTSEMAKKLDGTLSS